VPITPSDLSPEVREILDKATREGACSGEQPVCSPDPRVTAQLTDERPERQISPWRIANARKGDLILCPGGPGGMIGGLLSQVDDPQVFSHMGIMTADEVEIRQATAIGDRVEQFYNGSILGLEDAPTDGIQEHALRFLWPGTVTQSVERAYEIWHGVGHHAGGGLDSLGNRVLDDAWKDKDEVSGKSFFVDSMSFGPVRMQVDGDWKTVFPLVVKPCPLLETPTVRAALHRVADAAKDLRGHYRFFAYTRADCGLDQWRFGPRMLEADMPDPASGCAGVRPLVPVREGDTVPMVCSSFVWLAVQLANQRAAAANPPLPPIILDGRPDRPHYNAGGNYGQSMCASDFVRRPDAGKLDGQTLDGLYFYNTEERLRAAKWLHAYQVKKVRDKLDEELPGLLASLGIGAGVGLTVHKLLTLLTAWNAGAVATLLGLTPALLEELIVLTSDMPDDLANQIVNAFASDACETAAKDSDAWTSPGDGYAVSPDNILHSWAPPTPFPGNRAIHGLYGANQEVILRPPALVLDPPPPSTWQISQGFSVMRDGRVTFEGVGVQGALVRIGCTEIMTGPGGYIPPNTMYPSGRYWAVASYVDPKTGLLLESRGEAVEVPEGGALSIELELQEPPDTRRRVLIEGRMDLVNRYAIGKDWWGHPEFAMRVALLGLDYFPDEPEFAERRKAAQAQPRGRQERVDDWGHAELYTVLEIQPDRSVLVNYQARLKKDNDDPWQVTGSITAPPKGRHTEPGVTQVIDLVRSEMAWPVRAHIELTVHNDRAP
jgi:hypothetical protein